MQRLHKRTSKLPLFGFDTRGIDSAKRTHFYLEKKTVTLVRNETDSFVALEFCTDVVAIQPTTVLVGRRDQEGKGAADLQGQACSTNAVPLYETLRFRASKLPSCQDGAVHGIHIGETDENQNLGYANTAWVY